MSYEVLKNRITNGTPFLRQTATARINALADNLEITQEQAAELLALAQQNGTDALPADYSTRLERVEETLNQITETMKEV